MILCWLWKGRWFFKLALYVFVPVLNCEQISCSAYCFDWIFQLICPCLCQWNLSVINIVMNSLTWQSLKEQAFWLNEHLLNVFLCLKLVYIHNTNIQNQLKHLMALICSVRLNIFSTTCISTACLMINMIIFLYNETCNNNVFIIVIVYKCILQCQQRVWIIIIFYFDEWDNKGYLNIHLYLFLTFSF